MKASHLARLRVLWTPTVLIAAVAVVAAMSGSAAQPLLINLLLVVALYVFIGNSGVFSFGQMAFMALGAYACALLTIPVINKAILLPDLPGWAARANVPTTTAVLIAAVLVGCLAYLVAIPLMRLSGLAAGIATLALLVIVSDVVTNDAVFTGGSGNLTGVPSDMTEVKLVVWVSVAIVVAYVYQRSRFCRRLRASREDEVAARALGINVEAERRIAFTVSAMLSAVAGGLYSHYLGSVSPSSFYLSTTFLVIAMLVVGGVHSLTGAVSGAILLSGLADVLDSWERGDRILGLALGLPSGTRQILIAIVVIVVLLVRPEGLWLGREISWPFGRRRAHPLRLFPRPVPKPRPESSPTETH